MKRSDWRIVAESGSPLAFLQGTGDEVGSTKSPIREDHFKIPSRDLNRFEREPGAPLFLLQPYRLSWEVCRLLEIGWNEWK